MSKTSDDSLFAAGIGLTLFTFFIAYLYTLTKNVLDKKN